VGLKVCNGGFYSINVPKFCLNRHDLPAISVSSERMLSNAGLITSDRRSWLPTGKLWLATAMVAEIALLS